MELKFNVSPHDGEMTVTAKYSKDEINTPHFYINVDAEITSFLCDGKHHTPGIADTTHPLHGDYILKKAAIPAFHNCLEITYSLKLTGKTGSYPYVREQITPEFTLIRFETFCYPMFYEDYNSFRNPSFKSYNVRLTIPDGYKAVEVINKGSAAFYTCAIAPYVKVDFTFGSIYFFSSIGGGKKQMVEQAMNFTFDYMNAHFGSRAPFAKTTFAAIPRNFGSFAFRETRTIFIEEDTFDKTENLRQIIHEFLHLDWNAEPKDSVQRARFFDEAFTSYFETRVMKHLLKDEAFNGRAYGEGIAAIKSGEYGMVPICQYGERAYGDLSYTIGALCLDELCRLLGESLFDAATAAFLAKYRHTPADFEDFCREYLHFCGKEHEDNLTQFFNDWIYTCNGLEKLIESGLIPCCSN